MGEGDEERERESYQSGNKIRFKFNWWLFFHDANVYMPENMWILKDLPAGYLCLMRFSKVTFSKRLSFRLRNRIHECSCLLKVRSAIFSQHFADTHDGKRREWENWRRKRKRETKFSVYLWEFCMIMCKIQLPFELWICSAFEVMLVGYHCCMVWLLLLTLLLLLRLQGRMFVRTSDDNAKSKHFPVENWILKMGFNVVLG